MTLVGKSGFQGDLGQVPIWVLKKLPPQVQPASQDIRRQRAAKELLERAGQMDPVDTGRSGEFLRRGHLGESILNCHSNLPQPNGWLDGLIPQARLTHRRKQLVYQLFEHQRRGRAVRKRPVEASSHALKLRAVDDVGLAEEIRPRIETLTLLRMDDEQTGAALTCVDIMLGAIGRESNASGFEYTSAPGKLLPECPIGNETGVLGRVPMRLHSCIRRHPTIDDPQAARLDRAVANGFSRFHYWKLYIRVNADRPTSIADPWPIDFVS